MATAPHPPRPLTLPGTDPQLRLAVSPRPRHDIGAVISSLSSADLIAGVQLEAGTLWPDDRGFFTELLRLPAGSGAQQISAALSYPGTVKAVHYHRKQTDFWCPLRGQFQCALFDLRADSPTFGVVNTIFAGEWRPWRIRIPVGVGHGYKVVGQEAGILVYATDRFYDPADEGRIPYNDPDLNYDWETQFK